LIITFGSDSFAVGIFPPHFTENASHRAAAEALRNVPPEDNPRLSCGITSVLFDWVFDGPINRIAQQQDAIMIEYGRGLARTVHMNLTEHPGGVGPTRGGHSIGHWDGDTLVVDTVGFEPGRIAGFVPHSSELHIVERFTLDPETMALQRDYVAEDPVHFVDQYAGSDTVLPADAPFAVDECRELAYEYMPSDDGVSQMLACDLDYDRSPAFDLRTQMQSCSWAIAYERLCHREV